MSWRQVYLNNAAAAFPLAPGVTEVVIRSMQNPPHSGRDGGIILGDSSGAGDELGDAIGDCRRNAAAFLGVRPNEIVLCSGTTAALNIAILGLGLRPDDLIITSVMEHNSVLRPLARLEKLLPLRLEYVPLDTRGRLNEEAYEALLRGNPRLVALTHGSNVTGRINPIEKLFAKAKDAGAVTLLDAGQTVGHIPVKPGVLHADIAGFSGYKGLAGPQGTGILYVNSSIEIEPVITGGTGIRSDTLTQPEEMPLRLEAGTPNTHAFAGLNVALKYYLAHEEAIIGKEREITRILMDGLGAIKGVRILDSDTTPRLPVLSFIIEGLSSEEAGFALTEGYGIGCRTGLHCAPLMHRALGRYPGGSIRFSPSHKTPLDDIAYAIEAVRRIVS
jgi:selenocysteine lyase/cysteine desulfurase